MYIFHLDMRRHIQVTVRKIPDAADTASGKNVRHGLGAGLRNRQHRDVDIVLAHELFQIFHRLHFHIPDLFTVQSRVFIKDPPEQKSPALKIHLLYQSLSQIARAHQDQLMRLIDPEYFSDLTV